jgi:hypothetical protein
VGGLREIEALAAPFFFLLLLVREARATFKHTLHSHTVFSCLDVWKGELDAFAQKGKGEGESAIALKQKKKGEKCLTAAAQST